jgi:lipoprotein-releasing system ATP-binding protein
MNEAVRKTEFTNATIRVDPRLAATVKGGTHSPLRVAKPVAIRTVDLFKSYRKRNVEVPVLKGVDLSIAEGKFTAVVGQSGSGKSTLLHLLGTLDAPCKGEVWYDQRRIDNLPSRHRERLRNVDFGMIFQFYHLLPELSTLENVLVPQMIRHGIWSYYRHKKENTERAKELLDRVGLSHRLTHKPNQLSGGEMQRAAIARALISNPKVLLADEPTGNLDQRNGAIVMETLLRLCRESELTVIMVTHDETMARQSDTVVRLVDGRVC